MSPDQTTPRFPRIRLRRMRRDDFSRRLMRETTLTAADLIYPVFVADGKGAVRTPVSSMPGTDRLSIDELLREAETVAKLGVPAIALSESTSAEDAVKDAPIVTAVTRAREPIVTARMLAKGAHFNAVGAITPEREEFTQDVFGRVDLIAVDMIESVKALSAEFRKRFGAGDYPNQSRGGDGLIKWTEADRSVENTDVVLWYTFGHTHIPRPEDYPVMPTAYIGFLLKPNGFFDMNPANDVPPSAKKQAKGGCCH